MEDSKPTINSGEEFDPITKTYKGKDYVKIGVKISKTEVVVGIESENEYDYYHSYTTGDTRLNSDIKTNFFGKKWESESQGINLKPSADATINGNSHFIGLDFGIGAKVIVGVDMNFKIGFKY